MIIGNTLKHRNIKSFSLDKKTLEKVLKVLINENKKVQAEEFKNLKKNKNHNKDKDNTSDNDLQKLIEENLQVAVHVWGRDGEYNFISVTDTKQLEELIWPERISRMTIENNSNFERICKYKPINTFEVEFDFSYIDILDLSSSPTQRTFNNSHYTIIGVDEGWVLGVEGQLNKFLKSYENPFWNFIHTRNIYDFILWFVYAPCFLFSMSNWAKKYPLIQDNFLDSLQPVCFIVVFVLGLYLFRIFFNMTKRIFPFSSLKGDLKEPQDIWSYIRGTIYFLITTLLTIILSKIFG